MSSVGSYEAKTHLPELLERVRAGENFTITKHGVPVAELKPVTKTGSGKTVREAINGILEFQKTRRIKGLTAKEIKEMIHEGHKY